MRIRAAVLEEFAKPLVVQDVELDGPGPGEVLVPMKWRICSPSRRSRVVP